MIVDYILFFIMFVALGVTTVGSYLWLLFTLNKMGINNEHILQDAENMEASLKRLRKRDGR